MFQYHRPVDSFLELSRLLEDVIWEYLVFYETINSPDKLLDRFFNGIYAIAHCLSVEDFYLLKTLIVKSTSKGAPCTFPDMLASDFTYLSSFLSFLETPGGIEFSRSIVGLDNQMSNILRECCKSARLTQR